MRKLAVRKACKVITSVWKGVCIPTRWEDYARKKFLKFHDQWITLRKHKFRQSKTDQQRAAFICNLNKLYNISENKNILNEESLNLLI